MAGVMEPGDYYGYHKRACDEFLEYIAKKIPTDAKKIPTGDLIQALARIWVSMEK